MRTLRKIVALFAVLVASAVATGNLSAQGVPASGASAFLGAWTMNVEGYPIELSITNEGGQVASEINVGSGASKATSITQANGSLTLSYVIDIEGQTAPIAFKLTPGGAGMDVSVDVAQGMYTGTARATKKAAS
jgi:hypothetical protein